MPFLKLHIFGYTLKLLATLLHYLTLSVPDPTSQHAMRNRQKVVLQDVHGDVQLFSVYVPTNHIYVGDVFLLGKQDIIKVNLSVREGLGKQHQFVGQWATMATWAMRSFCNGLCHMVHVLSCPCCRCRGM